MGEARSNRRSVRGANSCGGGGGIVRGPQNPTSWPRGLDRPACVLCACVRGLGGARQGLGLTTRCVGVGPASHVSHLAVERNEED